MEIWSPLKEKGCCPFCHFQVNFSHGPEKIHSVSLASLAGEQDLLLMSSTDVLKVFSAGNTKEQGKTKITHLLE